MSLIITESFDALDSSGTNGANMVNYLSPKHGKFIPGVAARQGGLVRNGTAGASNGCGTTGRHGTCLNLESVSSPSAGCTFTSIFDPADEDDVIVVGFAHHGDVCGAGDGLTIGEVRNVSGAATTFQHVCVGPTTINLSTWTVQGPTGTALATFAVAAAVWKYVEVKVKVHDTAGTVEVRIDGAVVASVTGADTRNNTSGATGLANLVLWRQTQVNSTKSYRIDDVYILNEQGSAPFNDFLGDITVEYLQPNGAGSSTAWTPSATPNWDCVSDPVSNVAPQTSDSVSSLTTNAKDEYVVADLWEVAPSTVLAVSLFAYADKTDTGVRTVALVAKVGANENQSGDLALRDSTNGGPQYVRHVMPLNPAGSAWSLADVNAMEIGVVCRP